MIRVLSVAFLAFAADQASKWWVVERLDLGTRLRLDVLPPYLNFRMAWNDGINFGILSGGPEAARWILVGVSLIVSAVVLYWTRRFRGWALAVLPGILVGGVLGNALDRVVHGAVADFLNMSCCGVRNPYSFNLADVFIFAGAAGLVLFHDRIARRA